jgi:hypothetical protein
MLEAYFEVSRDKNIPIVIEETDSKSHEATIKMINELEREKIPYDKILLINPVFDFSRKNV